MRHRKMAILLLLDVAVALLVLVAIMAASAHAQPIYGSSFRLPDGPAAARAPQARPSLELAQRAWRRGLAREGCPRLGLSSDPPVPTAPTDAIGEVSGWAWAGDCVIHVRRHLLWLGGPELCEVVLHEAGHVAGRGHSSNPRSIMYPNHWVVRGAARIVGPSGRVRHVVQWSGVDRRCLRAYGARGWS